MWSLRLLVEFKPSTADKWIVAAGSKATAHSLQLALEIIHDTTGNKSHYVSFYVGLQYSPSPLHIKGSFNLFCQ